ncbi:chemotaxis protein [Pseudomonas sp. TCU-HL1]|nr:chemotaxis protein [Pseudomonas sp. TCU-HL1]
MRETIHKGSNLFVCYPGYSDYRHIPVIGKGVTFQLPGSPDRWGMMCEADLKEVYRRRSLSFELMKTSLLTLIVVTGAGFLLQRFSGLPQNWLYLLQVLLLAAGALCFRSFGPRRLAARMQEMTDLVRTIAEGEGNLAQRTASAAEDIRNRVEGLQSATRQAVEFMESDVRNVDDGLRLTEEASSENLHLHRTVERMFEIIKQLNQQSLDYGQTVRSVDLASREMSQSVDVLRSSSELVRHTENQLPQLVGQFSVSERATKK